MAAEPIRFEMQITVDDLRRYFRFTVWFKQKLLLPLLIFVLGIGASLCLRAADWTGWLGAALLAAAVCYIVSRLRLGSRFEEAVREEAGERYRVSIDSRGLELENLDRGHKLRHGWDSISEARELKGYFLLYQGPGTAIILPKRSLQPAQQLALDKLLRSRLRNRYSYA